MEKIVSKIIMNELALINEVVKALDLFYDDESFLIYDIIKFFNNGKDGNSFTDSLIEKFCLKYQIEITHNELKLLLCYLKADINKEISYSQLKNLFKTFIYDKNETNNHNFNALNNSFCKFTFYSMDNDKNVNKFKNKTLQEITFEDFIKDFINFEYMLYSAKKDLYSCDDFFPRELFSRFDTKSRNFFTVDEFKKILYIDFNIDATINEIQIIFYNYSNYYNDIENSEGFITYDNFRKIIIPYDCMDLAEKKTNLNSNKTSINTKSVLAKFFQTLLDIEKQIDNLKMNLFYSKNFSPYEGFLKLKGTMTKAEIINKLMFENYLRSNLNVHENEKNDIIKDKIFEPLFHRLDRDNDIVISEKDFLGSIQPFNTNI